MNIVLLGAPGAGKGTQGELMASHLHLKRLSTGDIFREILADPSHKLYDEVKVVKEGKLVSDETVNDVVRYTIENSQAQGFIFDGYPRTLAQAKALDQMLADMGKKIDAVVVLSVTKDVLMYRLLGRRICKDCKAVHHVSKGHDACPDCGGELYTREDDNEQTVLARFEEYEAKTAPLMNYYKEKDLNYVNILVDNTQTTPKELDDIICAKLSNQ